jgi:hypothetical protein
MLIIILFLITGICLGFSICKISARLKLNEGILTLTIYIVLFILVILTGVEDQIVKTIDSIGWPAFLLIIAAATLGTLIYRVFYKFLSRRLINSKLYTTNSGK